MNIITRHITGLMLVSGGLTASMLYAAVFPDAALQSTFGESLGGPVADVVVRNWGVLIGLVGMLLIHGAFNPSTRRVALVVATVSKLAFISLLLSNGARFVAYGAGTAVAVDSMMVALFVWYLVATRRQVLATVS
jgi:hypothetical protein